MTTGTMVRMEAYKEVKAKQVSCGPKKAECIVLLGEGAQRRSVTCYPIRENGGWVGYNPDAAGIQRRELAEDLLRDAQSAYRTAEFLANLPDREIKFRLKAGDENEPVYALILAKNSWTIKAAKKTLRDNLAKVTISLGVIDKITSDLKAAYPYRVRFVF